MKTGKAKIDPKTSSLLIKAVKAQMETGAGEMVINRSNILKKRRTLRKAVTAPTEIVHFKTLEEHFQAIKDCQKCPLGKTRTKFVYGVGNPNADILFIGEAPGRDEDLQGEPFVGRAGQLLDKILAAIKFDRKEIYIANILKCRPPNNRDPQPDEMAMCTPYLLEQIRLIKPKIICALGRIAAQALLQTTTPIGKLRGQWHQYQGIPFIVTYHPAALLRFPSYKKDVWDDVRMLRAKYDEMIKQD
ncbi:Bacteriophage-type DNA polymerase [Candidatus Zixiibacteriota bacterium]|nr:Bacteriophage-type DNA polymerase [candidate division Zixibacteria bacterium]